MFLPHPRVKVSIVGCLRDREVACSASDRQGSNFEFCVWRTVSSQSSHHPQEVLLAQFSLYVHKGGLKPDSFHFLHKLFSECTMPLDFRSCLLEKGIVCVISIIVKDGSLALSDCASLIRYFPTLFTCFKPNSELLLDIWVRYF